MRIDSSHFGEPPAEGVPVLRSAAEQATLGRQCDVVVSQLRDIARALEDAAADDAYPVGLVVGLLRGAVAVLEAIDWARPMRSAADSRDGPDDARRGR